MNRVDGWKNRRRLSVHGILFYAVGGLFILTMLSFWLVCGMYAKYRVSGPGSDSGRVAAGIQIELKEHEAELVNGEYKLNNGENGRTYKEVEKNTYRKVIPGVDIEKDPFVRLSGTSEVDFELYVKITRSADFPDTVTYTVDDTLWKEVPGKPGVYKYTSVLDSGACDGKEIYILKDNKLMVSEHYVGNGKSFTLTFEAWVEQAD